MEKGRMPDRVKSFREINSRLDRPRARPGFVKLIQNGLRKVWQVVRGRRLESYVDKKTRPQLCPDKFLRHNSNWSRLHFRCSGNQ